MKTKNSFDKHVQRTAGICGFKFSKKKKNYDNDTLSFKHRISTKINILKDPE